MKIILKHTNNSHNKEEKYIDVFTFAIHILAIVLALVNLVFNYYLELTASIFFDTFIIISVILSIVIYFKYKKYALGAYISILGLALGISAALYFEGRLSFNFLYYFAIILSVPFLIKRNKNFTKHNYILFILVTTMAGITILMTPTYPIYQNLGPDGIYTKMIMNSIISVVTAAMFMVFSVYVGRNYFTSFLIDKKIAEREKDKRIVALTSLGHELRTQITSINGITQLITEQKNEAKPNKELIDQYATILNTCNEQMLNLVNDVLDIHKIESGKFELLEKPENLNLILNNISNQFKPLAEKKGITFKKEIDNNIANINLIFDELRLAQILKNLLSNAIKYTEKGTVKLKAHITNETETEASILFKVEDTGIGILKENYSKIFESFQQIKSETTDIYGGTGLGLSLTKTILSKMQSFIKIENNGDQGSIFSFQINFNKISEENTAQNIELILSDKNCLLQKNILIADDNKVTLLYANTLLKTYRANTFLANNGLEAIAQAKKHNNLDIVLLDLEMPELNGLEAIGKLKLLNPELTIIAFTANMPSEELIIKLKAHGFDDFITKPFKKEELIKTVYVNCQA
ncbi:response regulator [Algibacter amylolyticus]|uniref:histidine kinase n=1 Tax=Algibacter amylolyticus TaxID=1608400 RepID=A0A5M7BEX8_9FLAO|nr:ATP-binding protein [Algibacter amylolyticus]KAA5827952.1 response regulator [Algibacter amylolyticus]MBB5267186.1 signal transduction histidine kinase/CheY-like chemotaxis protein [Algibacter amylolyticus]TSJ82197.1 response regulator [Algibacter amylolyticus]